MGKYPFIRSRSPPIPNSRLVVLPNERHSYFFANPDEAHKIIREFIKE